MRASAAVLIFAAWPCLIHSQITHAPREITSNSTNKNENLFHNLLSCVENLGLSKCASTYSVWRAERFLQNQYLKNLDRTYSWKEYANVTDEELKSKLCDSTERLLRRRPLFLNITDGYSIELGSSDNGLIHLDIIKEKETETGRGSMKKLYKMMNSMLPLLVVPGLLMSAILPFFLPTIKMMAMAAGMLNQMALTGAVFTLMRNHALGGGPPTKIVYVNEGYFNDKYRPLADTHSSVYAKPDFDTKISDMGTHDFKDLFEDINEQSDYKFNSNWDRPMGHMTANNEKILDDINQFNWGKEFSQLNDIPLINRKKG